MIRAMTVCLGLVWADAAPSPVPVRPRSLSDSVAALVRDVETYPNEFPVRAEKAWRTLGGPAMVAPSSPEIGRLRAYYFHRLMREFTALRRAAEQRPEVELDSTLRASLAALRKRYGKTEEDMRINPDTLQTQGPGRFRFLAAEALMCKDTLGALKAYRTGWERFWLEDDLLDLLALHAALGGVADSLLAEGLGLLPGSPGTRAAAFSIWIARGDSASTHKAQELSAKAQSEWDGSPEWKVRHARALLACGRPREAGLVLMRALDLLDEGQPGAEESVRLRKEIFELTESVRQR